MPRLLIDATPLSATSKGVGRYSANLIKELAQRLDSSWVMDLAVVERSYKGIPESFRIHRVSVPRLSEFTNGLLAIPLIAGMRRAEYLLLSADPVTAIGRKPTIAIIHDIPGLIDKASGATISGWRRVISSIKKILRTRMLRRCSAVICNSEFTATQAIREYRIDPSRIRIGYCGVDERFYALPRLRVQDWIKEPCVSRPYLLVFATGDPRERFDLCPAIFSSVRNDVPELTLVVAGLDFEEPYARALRGDLEKRGMAWGRDFVFVPFLAEAEFDKLHSLYRDAAFYLELSAHEGFGMSLAEAMACGTPCISSGAGALDEIGGGFPVKAADETASAFAVSIVDAYRRGMHRHRSAQQIEFTKRYNWAHVGGVIAAELVRMESDGTGRRGRPQTRAYERYAR